MEIFMKLSTLRLAVVAAMMVGTGMPALAQIHPLGDGDPSGWSTNTWQASQGRGWSFTVGSQDLLVSELGINPASAATYSLVLWDLANSAALASVSSISVVADQWTWTNLSSSVTLNSGGAYAVIGYGGAGGAYNYRTSSVVGTPWAPTGDVNYGSTLFCNSCNSSTMPTGVLAGLQYGTVDIGYTVAAPVPEPGNVAMMLAGLGVLGVLARRRQSSTSTR